MAIILTKINYCYKMSNFYPSDISYLNYCVTTKSRLVMQFAWIFLKIFRYYFLQGNPRKTMEKTFLKKREFSVKILARYWLMWIFFSRFSLFSKVIFLICSNITMSYITVPEILLVIYNSFETLKCSFFSILLTWVNLTMSID